MIRVWAAAAIPAAAWVLLLTGTTVGGPFGHALCGADFGIVGGFASFVARWSVMVAAMMLPEFALDVQARFGGWSAGQLAAFLAGFLVVWELLGGVVFGLAAIVHWGDVGLPLIDREARGIALVVLAAVALLAAAITNRRRAGLRRQPGRSGLRAGLAAGSDSLRCCAGIMTFMMAAGLHDAASIAALTLARLLGLTALANAAVARTR